MAFNFRAPQTLEVEAEEEEIKRRNVGATIVKNIGQGSGHGPPLAM